nr:hypothetical protein [Nonomuraea ferruginea]
MAGRGYDPVMGARPLRRTIQRELEDSAPLRRAPSGRSSRSPSTASGWSSPARTPPATCVRTRRRPCETRA